MEDLHRNLAPITAEAWEEIDGEAKTVLRRTLAARRLVEFVGPLGWSTCATGTGRADALPKKPNDGVDARLRAVQPLVEFRATFELDRSELDGISRGSKDPDLDPLRKAAIAIAVAEDRSVFHGYPGGNIKGIMESADFGPLTIGEDYQRYPHTVAEATGILRSAGVEGPYAIALGPRCYTGLTRTTTEAGYPVINHVRQLVDGPVVWTPGVDGAALLSLRGGDFELTVGRDLSIGYLDHDRSKVELYIEESLTFRVLGPEAAVPLRYATGKGKK